MRITPYPIILTFTSSALGILGCGLLYGPLTGPTANHCANNPSICTQGQQCDVNTGYCLDERGDMLTSSDLSAGTPPTVTGVSPAIGSNIMTTSVTITGANFHANPAVTVGGAACTAVNRISPTQLTCQIAPKPGTCGPQNIVVTNSDDKQSGTGTKLFSYGTASRSFMASAQVLTTDSTPWGIDVADFDKDGNLDLVTGSLAFGRISMWRGKGDGSFVSPATMINITGYAVALATVDIDRNGNPDLIVVSNYSPTNTTYLNVLLGDGSGGLSPTSQAVLPAISGLFLPGLAIADVNADTYPDVLVSNPDMSTVSVFLGNATGTPMPVPSSVMVCSTPGPLAAGDFDGDRVIDFAVSCPGGIGIAQGDGQGNFGSFKLTTLTTNRAGLATYDIDGNKQLDLFFGQRNSGKVAFSFGMGNLTFGPETTLTATGNLPEVIRPGDFDGDGNLDVLVTHDDTGSSLVSVFYGAPNAQFSTRADITTTASRPRDAAIGDFNKDGLLDFVALQSGGPSSSVYLGVCQ